MTDIPIIQTDLTEELDAFFETCDKALDEFESGKGELSSQ